MFGVLKSGGVLMIPILFCGIFATYIIVERFIYFKNLKKRDLQLKKDLNSGFLSKNFISCESACNEAGTPAAKVIKKALDCRNYDEETLKEIVETEMECVIPEMEKFLTSLGTIANIATLLGLLGTVTGNIKAFGVLGSGGTMGDPALLANAIAEALVTTVGGLCVSIPSLIFHNYFISRVNQNIAKMQAFVTDVVLKITGRIH